MESEKLHKSEREVATLKALEGTGNEREYEREAERAQERDKTREAARLKEALLTRCTHLTEKLRQAETLARIRTVNKEAVETGIKAVIHDLEGVMEYAHVMGHRIFNATQSATTPSALAPAVANTVSTGKYGITQPAASSGVLCHDKYMRYKYMCYVEDKYVWDDD